MLLEIDINFLHECLFPVVRKAKRCSIFNILYLNYNRFALGEIMNKVLMVIAPDKFRDEELFEPKSILESNGYNVEIASKGVKKSTGMLGGTANVDLDITKVDLKSYRAVVFVGGSGAAIYFHDEIALEIARNAYEDGKIIAAICIAPSILANSNILKGKKATSFPSEKDNLEMKGAEYTGESLTVDGKIITANGPKSAKKFGEEIVKMLKKSE